MLELPVFIYHVCFSTGCKSPSEMKCAGWSVSTVFTAVLENVICGYFSKSRLLEASLLHELLDKFSGNQEIRIQARVI